LHFNKKTGKRGSKTEIDSVPTTTGPTSDDIGFLMQELSGSNVEEGGRLRYLSGEGDHKTLWTYSLHRRMEFRFSDSYVGSYGGNPMVVLHNQHSTPFQEE